MAKNGFFWHAVWITLPEASHDEAPVTTNQIEYIKRLAPGISIPGGIENLGKWQASGLIEQLKTMRDSRQPNWPMRLITFAVVCLAAVAGTAMIAPHLPTVWLLFFLLSLMLAAVIVTAFASIARWLFRINEMLRHMDSTAENLLEMKDHLKESKSLLAFIARRLANSAPPSNHSASAKPTVPRQPASK